MLESGGIEDVEKSGDGFSWGSMKVRSCRLCDRGRSDIKVRWHGNKIVKNGAFESTLYVRNNVSQHSLVHSMHRGQIDAPLRIDRPNNPLVERA